MFSDSSPDASTRTTGPSTLRSKGFKKQNLGHGEDFGAQALAEKFARSESFTNIMLVLSYLTVNANVRQVHFFKLALPTRAKSRLFQVQLRMSLHNSDGVLSCDAILNAGLGGVEVGHLDKSMSWPVLMLVWMDLNFIQV